MPQGQNGWLAVPRPKHIKSGDMQSTAAKQGGRRRDDLSAGPHVAPRGHVNGHDRDRDEDRTLAPTRPRRNRVLCNGPRKVTVT
jgi:hypothetical protein